MFLKYFFLKFYKGSKNFFLDKYRINIGSYLIINLNVFVIFIFVIFLIVIIYVIKLI